MYQRVTHALAVYGKDPDKEVASKMTGKVSSETVKKIRRLNLTLGSKYKYLKPRISLEL